MIVASSTLDWAMRKILQEQQLGAGDALEFSRLTGLWSETGLRLSDLRDAVRELVDKGYFTTGAREESLMLQLTASGHTWLAERGLRNVGNLRIADAWALMQAKHRPWMPETADAHRRAVDQPSLH